MKKKMNNKGFSLVELIVVIAIMAVLIGVLAPTLLGNIEKSKLSKDKTNIDALYSAMTNAAGDPDIDAVTVAGITCTNGEVKLTGTDDYTKKVVEYMGNKTSFELESKYYKSGGAGTITFSVGPDGRSVVIIGDDGEAGDSKGDFTYGE